jgi:serine/threonine protein kinase/sugar lactone lactonase YvrE
MSKGLVLGKYEIIKEIGRGGMGVVYSARDIRIDRTVAVKELLINPSLEKAAAEIIARFHREAQTAGSLQHPNIVTIHDFGEDSGHHYIAMEFIEGKNLKEYMDEGREFTPDQLLDIIIQTCEGLQHAHDRKVIHRDIKPDNISITSKGDVKITDFGIARMSTQNPMMSMTQDGTMLGTLGYISPEQLQDSRRVDHRADIFSLGAMMYELYTSRLPFDGGNLGATILKIVSEDPVPPSRLNVDVDPRLEKVILKALQKLPDFRYQSAREISDELKSIRSGAKAKAEAKPMDTCISCGQQVFAGAKFCPYCGANQAGAAPPAQTDDAPRSPQSSGGGLNSPLKLNDAPVAGSFDREEALKTPMMRSSTGGRRASARQESTPAQNAQQTHSFKARLTRLLELATTYQTNPRAGMERQTFTRTQPTEPAATQQQTQIVNPMRQTGLYSPSTTMRSTMNKPGAFQQLSNRQPATATPRSVPQQDSSGSSAGPASPNDKSSLDLRYSHKIGQVGAGKGQFYQPRGLCIYQGLVFVADTQNQRIQVFNRIGDWQYLIRAGAQQDYLKTPCNVTVSPQGQIFVVDSGLHRVAIFDQSGRFIRAFGSQGKSRGEFSNPYGIAVSSKGEVYVADVENSRIQVLDVHGKVNKNFGRPGTRPGEFKTPYSIALDSQDNLYVLDYGIPRVQMLDRQGICRLDFGKRGVGPGEFSIPRGVAVDVKGRIYVADTLNHRVQIFTAKGEFIEYFGSKGRGDEDFWGPESVEVSEDGDVFVLDKGNSRIQVFKAHNF